MGESPNIGLIIFMGERSEHVVTSIQRYIPSIVHIVTSDTFKIKHSRRLKSWSEKFGFEKGQVRSISDLFEPTAAASILNEVVELISLDSENETDWHIGITGGKKGNNMLYLSGVQSEKVLTSDMIDRVVREVEKKASEIDNSK